MQLIGYLLLACIAMAALQAAVKLLLIALGIVAVVALMQHPRETLAFVALWMAMDVFKAQPAAVLILLAGSALVKWLGSGSAAEKD